MTAEPMPRTLDEAIDALLAVVPEPDRRLIAGMRDEWQVIGRHHFGLGMYVGNRFGLWGGNSAMLRDLYGDDSSHQFLVHADDASSRILAALWRRLRTLYPDVPETLDCRRCGALYPAGTDHACPRADAEGPT
jgi:hypothetical protein